MNTSDVFPGKRVVYLLNGGGYETAYVREVEHVDEQQGLVFLVGCDGYYSKESGYAYHMSTGRATVTLTPGFSSRIIPLSEY